MSLTVSLPAAESLTLRRWQPSGSSAGSSHVAAASANALSSPRSMVAADFEVLSVVKRGLALELDPVGALAEHAQPVGAQALGDVQVGVGSEELAHFLIGQVLQPHRQAPVVEPRGEHVAIEIARMTLELDRVAGAVGVVGARQRFVDRLFGGHSPLRGDTQHRYGKLAENLKNHKLTNPPWMLPRSKPGARRNASG
jgi:hypothetical protein